MAGKDGTGDLVDLSFGARDEVHRQAVDEGCPFHNEVEAEDQQRVLGGKGAAQRGGRQAGFRSDRAHRDARETALQHESPHRRGDEASALVMVDEPGCPMVLAVIVASEIAFWVMIVAGLVARYPMRRPRLGLLLLASVPVIDLVLLIATAADLRSGATAGIEDGLAAIYIGFPVAYGHRMIRWAPPAWSGGSTARRAPLPLSRTTPGCSSC